MTIPGKTLLDAAREGKVDLPFSCKMGGCGSCKVQMVKGEVVLAGPHCLDDSEVSDGVALTCRCVAQTDLKIKVSEKMI